MEGWREWRKGGGVRRENVEEGGVQMSRRSRHVRYFLAWGRLACQGEVPTFCELSLKVLKLAQRHSAGLCRDNRHTHTRIGKHVAQTQREKI